MSADGGAGVASNAAVKQIGEMLPAGRMAEGYLGVKSVVDMVAPLAQMFIPVQIQAPADLPPVGFGAAATDGAVHGSFFVPMPVIKFAMKTAQDVQNMQMQQMQQQEQQDQGGGKPRF